MQIPHHVLSCRIAALVTALLGIACSVSATEPLATFTATERLGVAWPRTLVTYRIGGADTQGSIGLKAPFRADQVRLVDAAGGEVPYQLSQVVAAKDGTIVSAWISFFATLPKDGNYLFTLLPGAPKAPTTVHASRHRDGILLENGRIAIRLPDGTQTFRTPRPLEANDTGNGRDAAVPGPVRGVRLLDGTWTGPAYFRADDPAGAPKVTGFTSAITAIGPLFAEAQVRYNFDNGGHYTLIARVLADEAAVRLDEQMDLRTIRKERDWQVVFPLTDAGDRFKPDVAWWSTPEGRFFKSDDAFEKAAEKSGFTSLPATRRHLGSMTFAASRTNQTLMSLAAWYPYAPIVYYAALAEGKRLGLGGGAAQPKETIPFVGVVPMHAGNWRGIPESSNGDLVDYAGGHVAMAWPLSVSPHPNTLLHTGEFDPALPYTFIRRQWALFAGPMQYHDALLAFRRYDGYVNLDDYKDWVLDWPEDPATTYPRLSTSRARVEEVKTNLDAHPMAEGLKQLLYFNDDKARAQSFYTTLASDSYWSSPRGHALRCLGRDADNLGATGWVAGFRHSQKAGWANVADELLASKQIDAGQRARLRAWIAACCYALAEPDFNPRGAMVHLGNPNMPMNRFFGLTFAAALIPDHPEAKSWLSVSQAYLRYILARNTAPGGGWSESLTYYMAGASHTMQAAMVLDGQGMLDDRTAALAAQVGCFPLSLIAPRDPRFQARAYPAWGHEGYWMIPTQWLPVSAFMRKRDPDLAKAMVWAWDQLGRPQEDHHDAGFSPRTIIYADLLKEIYEAPTNRLASRWIPGFGATMRAHIGDTNETFLAYRQGYMVSHCDANQGDFLLYSKGAPLTSLSLFQYAIFNEPFKKLYEEFGWHNRVRFGSRDNNGGWPGGGPISQVHRFASGESADYLRGLGDYGPQRWTRQLLFLKGKAAAGPNYFLLRDSFAALDNGTLEPKWWYLRTDGPTTNVTSRDTGLTYNSPWGPKLDVRFLAPAAITTESRQATQSGPLYNRAAALWKLAGNTLTGAVQQTMTITAAGPIPAGQDILLALYPQSVDEAPPEYKLLAPGVAKIVTGEGVDIAFLAAEPMEYGDGEITFRGRAGAVRLYPDEVHLVIGEGPGEVSYQGTTLKSDVPATRIIPRAKLAKVTLVEPVPAHGIRFAVDRPGATSASVQQGVTRWDFAGGHGWEFDFATVTNFDRDGVAFRGRKGGIVVDEAQGQVQLTLLDGERIGCNEMAAWGGEGPYTVTFDRDRITGRAAGLARFLYLTRPAGLDRLPTLVIDGQTYAPGTSTDFARRSIATTGDPYNPNGRGGLLIVPVLPGEHRFELKALDQPPIFRNWQAWPESTTETIAKEPRK